MQLQERKYQDECLDAIACEYQSGVHQQLVVMATGTGKAVLIGRLYNKMAPFFKMAPRMLVFAHREELIDQLVKTMEALNPHLIVGKEMANCYADHMSGIVVSCVASIGRFGADRLAHFGGFDIVVCDEAHHSIAETYLSVFEQTGVLFPGSDKLLVGFTATPKRKNLTRKQLQQVKTLDEGEILQLSSVYKKIVYSYPIRKAIKDGWLVPLKGFRVKTDVSLDDIKVTDGDYQQDELQDTVNNPARNQQIVKAWLENMEGRQSVGFTTGIQHAKDLAEVFVKYGVKAEPIWGVDPERKLHTKCDLCGRYEGPASDGFACHRDESCGGFLRLRGGKLERHQEKNITVLLNAQLLTEGYDDWRVRCIISAAPTRNPSKFTQEIGRGTRLQEGTGNLLEAIKNGYALEKNDCFILDVVDNTKYNSLVTFPSLMGLNPDMNVDGRDIVEVAEEVEALQDKYPGIDLSELTDIKNVKAFIESVDMFAAPFTEEVKEFSTMSWMHTADGSYVLSIPERKDLSDQKRYAQFLHEKLHIETNELDEFELSITTKETQRKLGTYVTLKEAFDSAEDVLRRCRTDRVKLLLRDAPWHSNPASEAAKKMLRSRTKKRPIFHCICAGVQSAPVCPTCGKQTGLTAGQASLALNILHTK